MSIIPRIKKKNFKGNFKNVYTLCLDNFTLRDLSWKGSIRGVDKYTFCFSDVHCFIIYNTEEQKCLQTEMVKLCHRNNRYMFQWGVKKKKNVPPNGNFVCGFKEWM